MFDYKNYNYYMLIRPTPGGWTFVGYEKDGKTYKAVQSIDNSGRIRNFNLYFSDRERLHRSHVNQEVTVIVDNDIHNTTKMKVSKYLESSPYFGIIFKKVDEGKDAKEVVSVKANRIKAESAALNLIDNKEKLAEIAQLLGVFKDDVDQQHRAVLEFSGQHPDKFMEMLDSADSEIKSLVLKGVNAGVLRQIGKVISWDSEVLGGDVDDSVKALVKDPVKLKALKAAVKKTK